MTTTSLSPSTATTESRTGRRSLADRLAQARRENFVDLRVTTPAFAGLHVRCRALDPEELTEAQEHHKGDEAGVNQAANVLAATCVGVWEEVDGRGVSPLDGFDGAVDLKTLAVTGALPTFADPELADALGVNDGTARAAVLALLAPNSALRLLPYGDALLDFSTGANAEVVRGAPGN